MRGLCLEDGAGNRSRTYDLRITNALLYQLSYAGDVHIARPGRKARQYKESARSAQATASSYWFYCASNVTGTIANNASPSNENTAVMR